MKICLRYLVLCLFGFSCLSLHAQIFTPADNNMESNRGPVLWGDIDNDDDLDLIIESPYLHFYKNNGASGFEKISLTEIFTGTKFTLFDSDNDGDLDILVEYYNPYILINNGSWSFSQIILAHQLIYNTIVNCSDLNNDGLEDIIVSGGEGDDVVMRIFSNLGGNVYEEVSHNCPGTNSGEIHFFDYDHDQRNDFIINGQDVNGNSLTHVYLNMGDFLFSKRISATVSGSSASLGICDYNNDGLVDFIQTGNGGTYVHEQTESGGIQDNYLFDIKGSSLSVFNFDNDSDMDITVTQGNSISFLTNQSDYSFTRTDNDTIRGYIVPSDYDKDGDLDFFMSGTINGITASKIFVNETSTVNTVPSVPVGLDYYQDGKNVYLNWNQALDDQTPTASLTYNIAIGTTYGSFNILQPQSSAITGYRKQYKEGNAGNDTIFMITDFSPGKYYWTVQSIDNTGLASGFSEIDSFQVNPEFESITIDNSTTFSRAEIELVDFDRDQDLDILVMGTSGYHREGVWIDSAFAILFRNDLNRSFTRQEMINFKQEKILNHTLNDLNNDNSVDVFIIGDTSRILINNNSGGFETPIFTGSSSEKKHTCSADINNDGKNDIFDGSLWLLNNSNLQDIEFTNDPDYLTDGNGEITSSFDFDQDGYTDFFNDGRMYRNSDNSFIPLFQLQELSQGICSFGNIDDDDDPDFIYSGLSYNYESGLVTNYAEIYLNDGEDSVSHFDQNTIRKVQGCVYIGDFDNDGISDVFVGGLSGSLISRLYLGKGEMNFQELAFPLKPTGSRGYMKYGDLDNDGDLDLIIVDDSFNFKVYYNNLAYRNKKANASENLQSQRSGYGIQLMWESAEDDHTPSQHLSYNVRIGTGSGKSDIVSPLSDLSQGYRYLVGPGNAWQNEFFILDSLALGDYYWSVQAIDGSFLGGSWSSEQSFTITTANADFHSNTICLGEETVFSDASLTSGNPISEWRWDFGDGTNSLLQNPGHTYSASDTFGVKLVIKFGEDYDSVFKEVIVLPVPDVNFQADAVSLGEHTEFINTSINDTSMNILWAWDFGDGYTSSVLDPGVHKYQEVGTYDVSLGALSENGCSNQLIKSVPVCNTAPSKPEIFGVGPNVVYLACSNDTANFYRWYFNDELIPGIEGYLYLPKTSTGNYRVEISHGGICYSSSDNYDISQVTGIERPDPWKNLRIYPNPTPGLFTLEMDNYIMGELIIDIYGAAGAQVINIKFHKETTHFKTEIDLSGQPTGVYLIALMLENYRINRNLIVE